MYSLKIISDSDIELVKRWLEQEHIAKWFGDSADWLDEIYGRH